jgi:phospho-N-acetylmuramoyl-pentapeptide-transferase
MTGISVTAGGLLVIGCLVAFFAVVFLMPTYIRTIRRLGMGKRIRVDGPQSHYSKEGTPTMGGLLIILVVIAISLIMEVARGPDRDPVEGAKRFFDAGTVAPLATLALVGALGTVDDWLNARTGDGIRARHKLIWQIVVALIVAWQIQQTYRIHALAVPFLGPFQIDPLLYILFGAFAIVASSNAVNITDGLDGLAGGLLVFAFVGFMTIAALNVLPQPNLAILCAIVIGAILGFLWFNVHPAEVFIGDSGALSLGAMIAVVALITGQVMLLPIIGLVFVLETAQDIAQILWFKWKGRRLFRMAPLHHHFELVGWPEEKITLRFWIVGALSALIGVAFYLGTRGTLR